MCNRMSQRLAPYRSSVFEEMSALARRYQAIDLGSGTPGMEMPDVVKRAAAEAVADGRNQYSPVAGEMELRQAIAAHTERFYGQRVDPSAEVSVTSGVTEGIYSAMASFIEPGDEVVIFEPYYDSYVPAIQLAGGVPVPVTLRAPDFRLDRAELAAAFSARTRALILNTPHNPTGKVFSLEEMQEIAALCQMYDVLAITDEVYEHIVFDGRRHLRLADLPGMWERTLTLSGAGKTFSCTGWRIGWAIGPPPLQKALSNLRQFTVFCASTPLQLAIAKALELPDIYFEELTREYQSRRDVIMGALASSSFQAFEPKGSFFVLASQPAVEYGNGRECCNVLARDAGVVPVPLDTFYLDPERAERMVRFTFCQRRETLIEAGARLMKVRGAAA